jgi:hypothetical protein
MLKGTRPDWFPDWGGQYVAIVGGGASVKRSDVDMLKDRLRVVVINESYQLAPWADVLYSCDNNWWQLRHHAVKNFAGMKVTQDDVAAKEFPNLRKIKLRPDGPGNYIKYFLMDEWGEVGSGQGSGFQVVNWLAQLAVKGMALLGYDGCTIDNKLHWHGRHEGRLNNPNQSTFLGWKQWMENAAPKLRELDIDMINCSMFSTIGCFPRHSVEDMLKRWNL